MKHKSHEDLQHRLVTSVDMVWTMYIDTKFMTVVSLLVV